MSEAGPDGECRHRHSIFSLVPLSGAPTITTIVVMTRAMGISCLHLVLAMLVLMFRLCLSSFPETLAPVFRVKVPGIVVTLKGRLLPIRCFVSAAVSFTQVHSLVVARA